jgi:DmsE family decaheme c-type cytochrome
LWLAAFAAVQAKASAAGAAAGKSAVEPEISQAAPAPAKASAKAATQTTSSTATSVGDDTCSTCHEKQANGYAKTPHHQTSDPRTPGAKQGCETCHGNGSEHAADPEKHHLKKFSTMSPDEVVAACTTCHNRGEHALWDGSKHDSRGVSCVNCHSVHAPASEKGQLVKKTQIESCATCHRDKASKLDRSGHMPVREGKMQCSTCHNTHGSTNDKMLRTGDSVAELCTSCHADKRGPYLWEHAPSREGCVTCHDPHGSSNDRMLVAKQPALCQRCHAPSGHPGNVYDATQIQTSVRIFQRGCVQCHSQIHGSNHPAGNRFIR